MLRARAEITRVNSKLKEILNSRYNEVEGLEFYRFLFPHNENKGEFNTDFSKPNAIYLYTDEEGKRSKGRFRRRIMLNDTWKDDYIEFVENNPLTLCSGLSYRGKRNRLENAQYMNAMAIDLDSVGENELRNLLLRIGGNPEVPRALPQPTFIVISGTGLHIYYVFKDPIELYPNIKLQLKKLKYDLTFRIWDYKGTSQEKQIQYQSINQGFRMVGSINSKYDLPVLAFQAGDRVSLEYLNEYVIEEENKVDINKPFKPSKYTLQEAKEKFPEWYQRVIVEGDKRKKKWNIKRDLYDWWLRQKYKIKGGHRYFYLMCMAIYGLKCDIPKFEVKRDMKEMFGYLSNVEHSNTLTKDDMYSALEAYDRGYYNFTIDDIEKLTDIRIERNKRNYRKQKIHLRIARSTLEIMNEERGKALQGRPSKGQLIKEYIEKNPGYSPSKIAKNLGVSRTTVYKYLK